MLKTLALVAACCALVIAVPIALANDGGNPTPNQPNTQPSEPQPSCDRDADHATLHRKLAMKRWRVAKPLRGTNLCLAPAHVRKHREKLRMYAAYRSVAPYLGPQGAFRPQDRWWAVPGYIVSCESHGSWSAYNPSGALGAYQLLGWGAPFPVRSLRDKLAHHRIAASLSLSNWVCA